MSIIIKTLDSKMLQDTELGVIIQPRRPYLVSHLSNFLQERLGRRFDSKSKSSIPPEVIIILDESEVPEGITDKEFGETWNKLFETNKLDKEFYKEDVLFVLENVLEQRKNNKKVAKFVKEGGNVKISTETGSADSNKVIIKTPKND